MGIKLLGQRECTNYLLKTPEISNMVLDAMLKEIWPKKGMKHGFHMGDKNHFRGKGYIEVKLNKGLK